MDSEDRHLIARFCKAYVVQEMQLNARAFRRTQDQAWITVAARLIRQQRPWSRPKPVGLPSVVGLRAGK